jgi:prepilin-type N-terminal cleavage/methylation domain-containing protein
MSVRKSQGFTLMELMVTVGVAAIIASFAIPSMRELLTRGRVNGEADQIVSTLALARNTAITTRRNVVLVVHKEGWSKGWQLHRDTDPGEVFHDYQPKESTEITGWQGAKTTDVVNQIVFNPSGFVERLDPTPKAALDLTLMVCDSDTRLESGRNITMSRIGRIVSTQYPDAGTCNP